MIRILLVLLFFVMLTADMLGLNIGLAPGVSVKNAFLYLILAGVAIDAALARNRRLELLTVVMPYGVLIVYAIISYAIILLTDAYPGYGVLASLVSLKGGLAEHLLIFLVFFYGVRNAKDTMWLLKMLIWIVIATNVVALVDELNLPNLGLIESRDDGRVSGPIGEPNEYAAILALFLPAIFALTLLEAGWRRNLAILGFGVSVLAFFMTVSRGGIVGVVGSAVVGCIFLRKFISGKTIVLAFGGGMAILIVAIAALYVAGYGELLYDRLLARSTAGDPFEASSGRTFLWGMVVKKMLEQPSSFIIGYGWNSYNLVSNIFFSPHNTYLKILFELGVIGVLLVLITFVNVLRVAREGLRYAYSEEKYFLYAFIFGLIGILVAIFFVDITAPWIFLWAYIGIAMRMSILQLSSATAQPDESVQPEARRRHRENLAKRV